MVLPLPPPPPEATNARSNKHPTPSANRTGRHGTPRSVRCRVFAQAITTRSHASLHRIGMPDAGGKGWGICRRRAEWINAAVVGGEFHPGACTPPHCSQRAHASQRPNPKAEHRTSAEALIHAERKKGLPSNPVGGCARPPTQLLCARLFPAKGEDHAGGNLEIARGAGDAQRTHTRKQVVHPVELHGPN